MSSRKKKSNTLLICVFLLGIGTALALHCSTLFANTTAAQLCQAMVGKSYTVTQPYLKFSTGNPTPDNRHAGIDYGAPVNTAVRCLLGGEVTSAGGDFGTVGIYDGNNTTFYLHLEGITVTKGKRIQFGTVIGRVGKKGTSKAHLHIEVRRGRQSFAVGPTSGQATAVLTYDPLVYF